MGDFDASFINMREDNRPWSEVVASPGSGTLYFPPGEHWLRPFDPAASSGRLIIPPSFILEVAQGATIVPITSQLGVRRPVDIEIQGEIRAGRYRIFATQESFGEPVGVIHMTARNLREVLPEWWGARRLPPSAPEASRAAENVAALQEAIRVAWTDRWQLPQPLPPVPISLSGTYLLNSTIEVRGPASPATVGRTAPASPRDERFILAGSLAGAHAPTTTPVAEGTTLRAVGGFSGYALLSLVDVPRFEFANLQLDGAGQVLTALEIRPPANRLPDCEPRVGVKVTSPPTSNTLKQEANETFAESVRQGQIWLQSTQFPLPSESEPVSMSGLIRECSFLNVRHTLVRVEHYDQLLDRLVRRLVPSLPESLSDPARAAARALLRFGHEASGTPILATPVGGEFPFELTFSGCHFALSGPTVSAFARGVLVRSAAGRSVRFQRCAFRGEAAAMVHLFGGTTSFTACVFDNARPPEFLPNVTRNHPPGGVDIHLENIPYTACTPEFPPPVIHVFGGRSTSWQFLRTTGRPCLALTHDQSVIQGLVHGCRHWSSGYLGGAIYWDGIGNATTLALIGCVLRPPQGATAASEYAGRVEVGPHARRVLDIATRIENTTLGPFVASATPPSLYGIVRTNTLYSLDPGRNEHGIRFP